MEFKKFYNITQESIELKKHNIIVPICLGNKFFLNKTDLTNNVLDYVSTALNYTKEKVMILVADSIQISNYAVRYSTNTEKYNINRLKRFGTQITSNLDDMISTFFLAEKDQINVMRWDEYYKQDYYCAKTTLTLYKEFKNNKQFQNELMKTVKGTITDRDFNDKQYWKLLEYILDEFSLIYSGIVLKDISYNAMIYPYSDTTADFIGDIIAGKKFPKLKNKLPKKTAGLAIINNY